ncbi:MAG: hypothetical protein IJP62_13895 [Treponema sp.]|nr:hypothetical protein [Treponema sp.]
MNEKNEVMSEELAEKEFERWVNLANIDLSGYAEDEVVAFLKIKKRISNAFKNGSLFVNDDGTLEYEVSQASPAGYAGDKVKISGLNGRAWLAADKYKSEEQIHKLIAVASAITGKDTGWFANLASGDFLIFTNIVSLFMNT